MGHLETAEEGNRAALSNAQISLFLFFLQIYESSILIHFAFYNNG